MNLERYLKEKKIKQAVFCEACGVSQSFLSQIIHNVKRPTLTMAVTISNITGGVVGVNEINEKSQDLLPPGYELRRKGECCGGCK